MTSKFLLWEIFCHVIDNHGDLGVSWRLAVNLAQRGHSVRLWVDDASALTWMAPYGHPHVRLARWSEVENTSAFGDVVIEAFGCKLPAYVESLIAQQGSIWINLEYLSAESYVLKSHGLASPVMQGAAKGHTKWFFYPGFVSGTGGLIRETDLKHRQSNFDRTAWLARYTRPTSNVSSYSQSLWISLFCYEPNSLQAFIEQLISAPRPVHLLVTSGRSQRAVAQALEALKISESGAGNLQITRLPYLSQEDFDHMLWACDLNFVRGEDSLVRALWSAKPFIWQIYPQDDQAHHVKLKTFCETMQMPHDLVAIHAVWNGLSDKPLPIITSSQIQNWASWAQETALHLAGQQDLVTQLELFVSQKR